MKSVIGDVRDLDKLTASVQAFKPDVVFHLAAQPLVRLSYKNAVDTYSTNVMGTVNILEAVKSTPSVVAVVNVTTDKCYENNEWAWGYRETDPMGGFDPYSSSKGCSELVTAAYRNSFFRSEARVGLATARAGNVIGGGDWSQDRLIPDILKAFEKYESVVIRSPQATRPWQHVLEPLSGYLKLAEALYTDPAKYADAWNFGPNDDDVKSVETIVEYLARNWGSPADWRVCDGQHPHESQLLKLDISKARALLGYKPRMDLFTSLTSIIEWHRSWLDGKDVRAITFRQINEFEAMLRENR
jgi:CDP-glucose 4,6-dehydratase